MLCSMPVVTFVPCTKPELARPFYEGVLGLRFVGEDQFAVVFIGKGVEFTRYPGMEQDLLGIWTSPNGARVAWFKDPFENVLSVTEL